MTDPVGEKLRQLLGSTYRIEREIARGGMATVYLATDLRHDRSVALKVMHPEIALALGRERFLREIRLAARLSHPNVLALHDSGEAGGLLYYVMPYAEGETLRHRLDEKKTLPVDEGLRLIREAAEAVGYAHSLGIVHRDIKPENILLSRGHAVVADFGIARAIDAARDDRVTETGTALGTPAYMSPEQALAEHVDARTDVWALGCMLYEMLTGNPPFGRGTRDVLARAITGTPDPVQQHRADVPDHVAAAIARSLARDPNNRFDSATAFADALASPTSSASSVVPASGRRFSPLAVATGFLLLVGAGAAAAVFSRDRNVSSVDAARPAATVRLSADSQANELYRLGRLQLGRRTSAGAARSIEHYRQALKRDSTFARAWAELARATLFAYRRGLEIPGWPPDSLIALGMRASERAIELDPEDPVSWLVKGRASKFVDPVDLTPALSALQRSLALDSMSADAWFDRAVIMEELFEPDQALASWLRAIELNPSDPQPLAFIGLHYMWTREYERGVAWADSAIAVDPTYVLGREAAAQLALEMNRWTDAQRHFEAATRVTSGREQALQLAGIARALAGKGDTVNARARLGRAKALIELRKPNSHESVYIAASMAALGDTADAVQLLSDYQPNGDVHFQLHLKRDPALSWLSRHRTGARLLAPDPPKRITPLRP